MKQVCNISFVAQMESFVDEAEQDKWLGELQARPGERRRVRNRVDPGLLALMGPSA